MPDPSLPPEDGPSRGYQPRLSQDETDEDDSELLRRIAADDDEALHHLYQRYAGPVYSLAYHILHDTTSAEDVLQETFLRIWRAAVAFDPVRGHAEPWIMTIARNLSLTALRKQRTNRVDGEINEQIASVDESSDPEAAAWRGAQRRLVQEALAQLPQNQRQVVLLAYFSGLTHVEIAARTGEPLGTVKSRLRMALRRLEAILSSTLGDAWDVPVPGSSIHGFGQPELGH